jgi:RNA polymerase sigma factor (sigma-70 family)
MRLARRLTAEPAEDRIDRLFREQYPKMLRLAYSIIGDDGRAEEIVQDGFMDLYRSFDELREPAAYLRVCVVNRCRSELRRRRVRELHPPEPPPNLSEFSDDLWDVLEHLTEDQRVAVVLKYYGRFRSSEIAQIMEIAPSTVRYHLREALRVLKKELEP